MTDITGAILGGIVGGVGASIGSMFLLGVYCWTGWCIFVFGPVGGFVGGIIGSVLFGLLFRRRLNTTGSGNAGCEALSRLGCLGAIVAYFSLLIILAILS